MRSCFALILVLTAWQPCSAQVEPDERNATQQEIVGAWRLEPLPDALEPKAFSTNPWPAPCQWFAYGATGTLKSIDHTATPCDNISSARLDRMMALVPAVISWRYDLSPVFNKGVVIVTRSDVKGYMEIWDPHFVTRSFSRGGADFQEGDLLLYLVNPQSKQIGWIRHLRKIQTTAETSLFITIGNTRFFLASEAPEGRPSVREYVPAGETLENWKQLASIRVFKKQNDPRAFLDGMGHALVKSNPEARYDLVQNNGTKDFLLDFMDFPPATSQPFYAEWNLWRASYVEGTGLVAYQYARRIYVDKVGPEFSSTVEAARAEMYNAFAAATFVEAEDTRQ